VEERQQFSYSDSFVEEHKQFTIEFWVLRAASYSRWSLLKSSGPLAAQVPRLVVGTPMMRIFQNRMGFIFSEQSAWSWRVPR
jgi:hypothetical protein